MEKHNTEDTEDSQRSQRNIGVEKHYTEGTEEAQRALRMILKCSWLNLLGDNIALAEFSSLRSSSS